MNTKELGDLIERFAPLTLQEPWDNSGWNVHLHNTDIRNVMLCLDVTPPIIEEAAHRECQVIISHHPLLFCAIRKVDGDEFTGSCLQALMANHISLYCSHTAMDSSPVGINATLANMLGLENTRPLEDAPGEDLYKIAVTVPPTHAQAVWDAMTSAGAGQLGDYADCTFSSTGTGTFRALPGADPFIGKEGALERIEEVSIQALVTQKCLDAAIRAIYAAHPYEMPAVDVFCLKDSRPSKAGMGRVGDLKEAVPLAQFAARCAKTLNADGLRVRGDLEKPVLRCALCGGAGGDLVAAAKRAQADVLLTADIKHNVFVETDIALIDAGHYDTEKCFIPAMRDALQRQGLEVQYKVGICVSEHMHRPYIVM